MQITRLENSLLIEHDGISVQHALNSLVVYINDKQKTITIKDQSQYVVSDSIDHITVDGQQMTADNIQQLLEPLFGGVSTGNSSVNGSQNNQSEAYTKISYSDPLVFPTPQRTGHIVEVYKDDELYQTYQWCGWYWMLSAQLPNLVYAYTGEGIVPSNDAITSSHKDDDQIYLSIQKGAELDLVLDVDDLVSARHDYSIQALNLNCAPKKQQYEVSNLITDSISITQDYNFEQNQIPYSFSFSDIRSTMISLFSIPVKDIVFKNVVPFKDGYDSNSELVSSNLHVTNSHISYIFLELQANNDSQSHITLANNRIEGMDIYVPQLTTVDQIHLEVINNSKLSSISITGERNNATIGSVILDFDETSLRTVGLRGLTFSEDILESFVQALTCKNYTQNYRYISIDANEYMTQDRIERLTNAGWIIQN